jgi:hypothetical protein
MMLALIADDGTASGIATSNPHLAYSYYAGLYHVLRFTQLAELAQTNPKIALRTAIDKTNASVPTDFSRRPKPIRNGR